MLALRCRQYLYRQMLPRTTARIGSAHRSVVVQTRSLSFFAHRFTGTPRRLMSRFNSTNAASSLLDKGSLPVDMHNDEARRIVEHAKRVWPGPPIVPVGWSCDWERWSYFLTFYWLSPYYLMLPQVEMVVNIRYRIPGETRPILYSPEKESFIFTMVADDTRFYLYDFANQELSQLVGFSNVEMLVRQMDEDFDAIEQRRLDEDPEGMETLQRVLDRDETVIPILAEKFLDYTPEPTNHWEESLDIDENEEVPEDDEDSELKQLIADVEKKVAPEEVAKAEAVMAVEFNELREFTAEVEGLRPALKEMAEEDSQEKSGKGSSS